MKKLLPFMIVILMSVKLYSQTRSQMLINTLEKGINNPNFLRADLLEKGFKYDKSKTNGEDWTIPHDDFTDEISVGIYKNASTYGILYQVRKDLYPEYVDSLSKELKAYYPLKTVQKTTISQNKSTRELYTLVYSNPKSSIEVNVFNDPQSKWFIVDFRKRVKR